MKKLWLFVLVAAVAISGLQAGASEKAAPWIDKMIGVMEKAYTYKYTADMTVSQMGQSMKMKMNGGMEQADLTHYRGEFDMTMEIPGMPEGMNMGMLMVADGTTAWMEMNNPMMGGKQVMKLDLEGLDKLAEANPQIKGMQDMNPGMQLKKMTDVFDVDLVGVSGGKVTLSAEMTDANMKEVLGQQAAALGEAVKKMTLVIDEKTATPLEVRIGEPSMLTMNFTEFSFVDPDSLDGRFSYSPPEGAQVMDLGAMLGAAPQQGN